MSLLNWFTRKTPPADAGPSSSRDESTRPSELASSRKMERMARRELLYTVVRDSLVRAGVLSSSYRFKVLSLDGRGRQFLIMIDLTGSPGRSTAELARVETQMAQAAKAQHGILVKAVYWREGARAAAATKSQRAANKPAEGDMIEGVHADEVAAVRKAFAGDGETTQATGSEAASASSPRSYTLLTGFEDTEAPAEKRPPALSTSQHGELR